MNTSVSSRTSTEDRALTLLGSGLGPEVVANATGVSASRISQLLSDPEFAAAVAELRFQSLQKHNVRDSSYDSIEDSLIERLRDCLPLMMRPMEILKAIQVINAAKRRGQSAPDSITNTQTIVNVVLPAKIVQKFTTNINNQVIEAGPQKLLTIQSGGMEEMSKKNTALKLENSPKDLNHVTQNQSHTSAGVRNDRINETPRETERAE